MKRLPTILFLLLPLLPGCTDEGVIYDGINAQNNQECQLLKAGEPCLSPADCCSGICESDVCVNACLQEGFACEDDVDTCCDGSCVAGFCTVNICASIGESCVLGSDCCSSTCDAQSGLCSSGGLCLAAGEICSEAVDGCCSGSCQEASDGVLRCSFEGYCQPQGERCSEAGECCSGLCTDSRCATMAGECLPTGEICAGAGDCCSEVCTDNGLGFLVCGAVSGCSPAGELCTADSQCCSDANEVESACAVADGADFGLCSASDECGGPGEMCGFSQLECCGGVANCQEVSTGVWRCVAVEECRLAGVGCERGEECCSGYCSDDLCQDAVCLPAQASCSFGEQCCSGICTPQDIDGTRACRDTCVPLDEACSVDTDCCEGGCHPTSGICIL